MRRHAIRRPDNCALSPSWDEQTRLLLTGTAAARRRRWLGIGPHTRNRAEQLGNAQLNAYPSSFAPHIADNLAMVNAQLDSNLGRGRTDLDRRSPALRRQRSHLVHVRIRATNSGPVQIAD